MPGVNANPKPKGDLSVTGHHRIPCPCGPVTKILLSWRIMIPRVKQVFGVSFEFLGGDGTVDMKPRPPYPSCKAWSQCVRFCSIPKPEQLLACGWLLCSRKYLCCPLAIFRPIKLQGFGRLIPRCTSGGLGPGVCDWSEIF